MNLTEKLPKYIAAVIAFGTFVGLIHNVLFYRFFNINYFAFADFTEVLNVFLPSVFFMITLLAGPFAYYITRMTSGKAPDPNADPLPYTNNPKYHTFWNTAFIVVVIVILIIAVISFNSLFFYCMLGVGFISAVTAGRIQRLFEKLNVQIPYYKLYLVNMMVEITIVSIILPFLEVKYNVLSKHPTQVNIIMKDSTVVKTDSANFYINQTKNYLFMYNKINHLTTVFKTDDVKRYEFKSLSTPSYID